MISESRITKEGLIILIILLICSLAVIGSTIYGFIEIGRRQHAKEQRP